MQRLGVAALGVAGLACVGATSHTNGGKVMPHHPVAEYIQLVRVDAGGMPTWDGGFSHWIVVSAQPEFGVDQRTAGGAWPLKDCGEASVVSVLAARGVASTVREEEAFGTAAGTTPEQLVKALAAHGVRARAVNGTAPGGYVMNPDFGDQQVTPPSTFALYAGASEGVYVVVP